MLIALNKPFNVLCQFTDRSVPPRRTLAQFVSVPDDPSGRRRGLNGAGQRHPPGTDPWRNVYPAGRLDYDSEGLVLLTDDGAFAHRLTDPRRATAKTYVVQVE